MIAAQLNGLHPFGLSQWPLEEPEPHLHPDDAANGIVDELERDFFFLDQSRQMRKGKPRHIHVHAGAHGAQGCFGPIARVSVVDDLSHRVPVAHHESFEAPLFTQNLAERELRGRARYPRELVEGAHHDEATFVDGCLERRKIHFTQRAFGNIDGVVVASAFCRAVRRVVLHAGGNGVGVGGISSLEAANARAGDGAPENDVFACSFRDAAPASVAGDVHHRGERAMKPGSGSFARRHASCIFDERQIPARRLG